MNYFVLTVLWTIWCVVHSAMISVRTTQYLKRVLGARFCYYRLVFNVVAVATLIPIVLYKEMLRGVALFRWEGYMIVFQVLLLAIAILLFLLGARHYDMLQFLGIRQVITGASHSALTSTGELETRGVLGITRHPWYLAGIMLVWTSYRELDMATLVTNVILTIYLVVGTLLEERKLAAEYGEKYQRYKKKVSMLIPWKYIGALLSK